MSKQVRFFCFMVMLLSFYSYAQDKDNLSEEINVDDLGDNTDEFQETFFKAIAQRAVENPQKAIEELERCLKLQPKNTAVYYELAKNYIDLEAYDKAETFLKKTLEDSKYKGNINIHKQLFYVYSMQKRYEDAIEVAQFIAEKDPVYYQELSNLYLIQNEYQQALEALDRFDATEGLDEFRDQFRMVIYKEGNILKKGVKYFEGRFQNSLYDTRAATYLMELHRLNNAPKESIKVGIRVQEHSVFNPEINVELALAYLVTRNIPKAKAYSQKVVKSLTLEEKDKVKVINTFKAFALQNPDAQDAFVSVLDSALTSEKNSSSKAELGEFYKSRDKEKALDNYKSALRNKPNDFRLITNIIELEVELNKFEDLFITSEEALQSYPSQALLYYSKGLALNKLKKHLVAIEVLEEGLDYIFEDSNLKRSMFEILKDSYLALGETEKAEVYKKKLIIIAN
jgi:tetratricopeptide (TPR) repeat protein